jgi:hypothetical protein
MDSVKAFSPSLRVAGSRCAFPPLDEACFSSPRCWVISGSSTGPSTVLAGPPSRPPGPTRLTLCSFACENSCSAICC